MWQPDGEQFTRVFRLKRMSLSLTFISGLLSWQEQELIGLEGYLTSIAKEKSKAFFSRLDD